MRKRFLAIILSICLVISCMFMFGGCNFLKSPEIELKVEDGYVQYYDGESWKNLIAISDLKGNDGSHGNGIKSIIASEDPAKTNNLQTTYIITFDDDTTYEFVVKNGTNGKDADVYTIGSDGYWYKNGAKTEYKAVGQDASFETYTITYNYTVGKSAFTNAVDTQEIKPAEWILQMPTITSAYEESFLGWYVEDTDKKIELYDFVGGDVTLEPRFDTTKPVPAGLYQNGRCVYGWDTLLSQYPNMVANNELTATTSSESYFKNLTGELFIKSGITTIAKYAFWESRLTRIVIPDTVTSIKQNAFAKSNYLKTIELPNSVTTLGESVFTNCSALTNVTIPSKVTTLPKNAFRGCSRLVGVTLPNGLLKIMNNAFSDSGLDSILLPNTVTTISNYAFSNCDIISINIPSSVTSIGLYVFQDCDNLTTITVDSSNTVYDSRNNCNAIITTESNSLIVGVKTTVIPSSVTAIGTSAFVTVSADVVIPEGVTTIGTNAFQFSAELQSIKIPSTVTTISTQAFYGCKNLTEVVIDSATVANGLTSASAFGYLASPTSGTSYANAVNIFIKAGLSVASSTYLTSNFTKQSTSTLSGYAMYTAK